MVREAEDCAAELQVRTSLSKADNLAKITLHAFVCEHGRVMKGQVAYGTLQEHMRALRLPQKFIGGSIM
jgi:hypothetical protein